MKATKWKPIVFFLLCAVFAHYIWLITGTYFISAPSASSDSQTGLPKKKPRVLFYKHPMGKNVTSPVPAKDEMGMDFIPVYEDEIGDTSQAVLDGRTSFLLSEASQQMIGVTKATAKYTNLTYEIRASGRVAFDPDLYAAITEYRVALNTSRETSQSGNRAIGQNSEALVQSARLKLRLQGLSDTQINSLGANKMDPLDLLLPKNKVWVYADVFEYELQQLKEGQEVVANSPFIPDKVFTGTLSSIGPVINTATRTVTVRSEVRDEDNLLRPGTFVTVRIKSNLGNLLTVPSRAIVRTGGEDIVYVVESSGKFSPRKVTVGAQSGRRVAILSGLTAGESVVTSANFLVDSESRLQAVVQSARAQQNGMSDLVKKD